MALFSIIKTNKIIPIACFLLASYNSISQNYADKKLTNEGLFVQSRIDTQASMIDGSKYYNQEWINGNIQFDDGSKIDLDSLNYDVFNDRLSYIRDGVEYYPSEKGKITSFSIGSSAFINVINRSYNEREIFEVIFDNDKLRLLKKHNCIIKEGSESKGYIKATNDKYLIKSTYYVENNLHSTVELPIKRKNILNLMGNKKTEMEKFIQEKNLNIKKEKDLVLVFKEYSQISKLEK